MNHPMLMATRYVTPLATLCLFLVLAAPVSAATETFTYGPASGYVFQVGSAEGKNYAVASGSDEGFWGTNVAISLSATSGGQTVLSVGCGPQAISGTNLRGVTVRVMSEYTQEDGEVCGATFGTVSVSSWT